MHLDTLGNRSRIRFPPQPGVLLCEKFLVGWGRVHSGFVGPLQRFYKFCELLGADEYLPYLPLLKSTQKLYECDKVWKQICAQLGWEFIRTV